MMVQKRQVKFIMKMLLLFLLVLSPQLIVVELQQQQQQYLVFPFSRSELIMWMHTTVQLHVLLQLHVLYLLCSCMYYMQLHVLWSCMYWRYMRKLAVTHRDMATLVSMEDKHKVKVGEPFYPFAAVERGKQVMLELTKSWQWGTMTSANVLWLHLLTWQ